MKDRSNIVLNAPLQPKSVNQEIALGCIAIDREQNLWGLTSAQALEEVEQDSLSGFGMDEFAKYSKEEQLNSEINGSLNLIARCKLNQQYINTLQINRASFWPRHLSQLDELTGRKYIFSRSIKSDPSRTDGTISSSCMVMDLKKTSGNIVQNAKVILADPITKGPSTFPLTGSSFVTRSGGLIGLSIGRYEESVILVHLGQYLVEFNLRLFVPICTHWSAIPYMSKSFETLGLGCSEFERVDRPGIPR